MRLLLTSEIPAGKPSLEIALRPSEAAGFIEHLASEGITELWTVCQATINVMPIGEVVTDAGPWTPEQAEHFRRAYERETMYTSEILTGMGLF